jgi:hypothetical protein
MPKALRPFFRHDRRLFAEVSRLIYAIIAEFYAEAAGRPLLSGLIVAHSKTPKASVVRRPIEMESSFPCAGPGRRIRCWRHVRLHSVRRSAGHDRGLSKTCDHAAGRQATPLRGLRGEPAVEHDSCRADISGFSIDNSVRVADARTKESLAQYISRPPVSLKKIRYEPFKGRVLFHTTYSEYFKENTHLFDALDFLAELTQHIPPKRVQLIRRYGLHASRTKGCWTRMPHVGARAPEAWERTHQPAVVDAEGPGFEPLDDGEEVSVDARKRARARLLAKVYEIDPLVCPKCG